MAVGFVALVVLHWRWRLELGLVLVPEDLQRSIPTPCAPHIQFSQYLSRMRFPTLALPASLTIVSLTLVRFAKSLISLQEPESVKRCSVFLLPAAPSLRNDYIEIFNVPLQLRFASRPFQF